MSLIVLGSVVELAGIPGAGKTTALEKLKHDYESTPADRISSYLLKLVTATRVDRLFLLYTGFRNWKLIRFVAQDQHPLASAIAVIFSPLRKRPSKTEFGSNSVLELIFLLNDIGRRNFIGKITSILTQNSVVIDELWVQGMIGIWLRIPAASRAEFWQRFVASKRWNPVILFSISGNSAALRIESSPTRPVIRHAVSQTSEGSTVSAILNELNQLLIQLISSNNTVDAEEQDSSATASLKSKIMAAANGHEIALFPRKRLITN